MKPIKAKAHKDKDGEPTCAKAFPTGPMSEVYAAKALCAEIGCSKISRSCDESPQDCEIVRKIMGGKT